mgnify:CR=1 FL=1
MKILIAEDEPSLRQNLRMLLEIGVKEVVRVGLPWGAMHLDGLLNFLDRDLANTGLLDDVDDRPDAIGATLIDALGAKRLEAARTLTDRAEQRFCVRAEERKQQQLLFTRGQTFGLTANRFEIDFLGACVVCIEVLDGTRERRIDRTRRLAVATRHKLLQLVDDQIGRAHV